MKKATFLGLFLAPFVYFSNAQVKINEVVVDPQKDHNESGTITDSDEYFELYNFSTNSVNLNGWRLELTDSSPVTNIFSNVTIPPKGFYVLQNPVGAQNNNGRLDLFNDLGQKVDEVIYGNWEGSYAPDGNSTNLNNEALMRYPDGSTNWVKGVSSRGRENGHLLSPRIYITKTNNNYNLKAEGEEGKEYVLQKTENPNLFQIWSNIYTNSSPFEYNDDNKREIRIYRLKEK